MEKLPLMSMLTNFNYSTILNSVLISKDGYKFGNGLETVSSVLGKNQLIGSLSPLGLLLISVMDIFDKDHALKSIKNFN